MIPRVRQSDCRAPPGGQGANRFQMIENGSSAIASEGRESQFSFRSSHWQVDRAPLHAHTPKSICAAQSGLDDFLLLFVMCAHLCFHICQSGMPLSLGRDWLSGQLDVLLACRHHLTPKNDSCILVPAPVHAFPSPVPRRRQAVCGGLWAEATL